MKCQRCQERDAEVHLTEILDDQEKRETHLCEACAEECAKGEDSPLVGSVLGMLSSAVLPPRSTGDPPAALQCDRCGLGYREFRARGRLGCPACYTVFQKSLEPLLEKIHGGTRHVGKAPDESSAVDRSRERRLVAVRRELQAAVREERYEEAARLRDRLTRLESGELGDEVAGAPGDAAAPPGAGDAGGSADADR